MKGSVVYQNTSNKINVTLERICLNNIMVSSSLNNANKYTFESGWGK